MLHQLPRPWAACGLLLVALSMLAGCGKKGPELQPVTGIVTFKGAAVADAQVVFENAAQGIYLTATTDAEGKYQVRTIDGEGLPAGEYQIAVRPAPSEEVGLMKDPGTRKDIPDRYRKSSTSGLSITVTESPSSADIAMGAK